MRTTEFDHPVVDDPALSAFARLAERFCALVDAVGSRDADAFARDVHLGLAHLYAGALQLPSTDILFESLEEEVAEEARPEDAEAEEPDQDEISQSDWERLFGMLSQCFGDANSYREVYDPYDPPETGEVFGNLADDVADIYRDVRRGLLKWRREESGAALWEWRFGLEVHWGAHATDALRALHARLAWWGGSWPSGHETDDIGSDPGA